MSSIALSSNIAGFVTSFIRRAKVEPIAPVLSGTKKFPYGAFFFQFSGAKGSLNENPGGA